MALQVAPEFHNEISHLFISERDLKCEADPFFMFFKRFESEQ